MFRVSSCKLSKKVLEILLVNEPSSDSHSLLVRPSSARQAPHHDASKVGFRKNTFLSYSGIDKLTETLGNSSPFNVPHFA